MPTYEYVCEQCRLRFERFQKINDAPITQCPECAGPVRRLINGGVGMIFKGSGFYITDYKKENKTAEKEQKSPEQKEPKASTESTGKTDAA